MDAGPAVMRRRLRVAAPLIVQCAVLAGGAWWISQSLLGHPTPIFAATAALICLTAGMGGRGRQAVDLFVGVLAGVLIGEGVRALHLGGGFWLIIPAVALAMSMAALLDPRPLTYIQAGAAVLIVVTVGASSSPTGYLLDAAVGGAVGLLGSQVLFSPDPVKLVEAPVREILRDAAEALRSAAEAVRRSSVAQADAACGHAREAHARLGELSAARTAARRVTGRTVRGRRRASRLRAADQPLDDVDVLVAAVLLLCEDVRSRLERPTPPPEAHPPAVPPRPSLPDQLTALADGLTALADRPLPAMRPAPPTGPPPLPTASPAHPCSGTAAHPYDVHLQDVLAALHRLRAAPVSPGTPPSSV
ncbi:FUSC family protein [Micromonospora sp. CPCC 205711]|uniref:FUSC family protein n=1 Tax=Micromonospora sp. CPCC 205547 TaxID=3122400 RepID=UPI002FF0DFE9